MAISDVYTARNNAANNGTITTTSTLPLLSVVPSATTIRLWVVGIRVELGQTAAAAGNNVLFQLARPGNTMTYTSPGVPAPHDFSAPASIGISATTWSTSPTLGTILWEQELPQTTGSAWEEFPPLGYEWGVPAITNTTANAGVHVFATATVGTSTPAYVDVIFSE